MSDTLTVSVGPNGVGYSRLLSRYKVYPERETRWLAGRQCWVEKYTPNRRYPNMQHLALEFYIADDKGYVEEFAQLVIDRMDPRRRQEWVLPIS